MKYQVGGVLIGDNDKYYLESVFSECNSREKHYRNMYMVIKIDRRTGRKEERIVSGDYLRYLHNSRGYALECNGELVYGTIRTKGELKNHFVTTKEPLLARIIKFFYGKR